MTSQQLSHATCKYYERTRETVISRTSTWSPVMQPLGDHVHRCCRCISYRSPCMQIDWYTYKSIPWLWGQKNWPKFCVLYVSIYDSFLFMRLLGPMFSGCHSPFVHLLSSSLSRMSVMNHNWSATKQHLHPRHTHVRHHLRLATRTQISVCKSPFPSAGSAVSLFCAKTVQQRLLSPREVETLHLSRLPVMPPSTFDVNWLQI